MWTARIRDRLLLGRSFSVFRCGIDHFFPTFDTLCAFISYFDFSLSIHMQCTRVSSVFRLQFFFLTISYFYHVLFVCLFYTLLFIEVFYPHFFLGRDQLGRVTNAPGPGIQRITGVVILDNHAVNFISVALTALLAPWIGLEVWSYVVWRGIRRIFLLDEKENDFRLVLLHGGRSSAVIVLHSSTSVLTLLCPIDFGFLLNFVTYLNVCARMVSK